MRPGPVGRGDGRPAVRKGGIPVEAVLSSHSTAAQSGAVEFISASRCIPLGFEGTEEAARAALIAEADAIRRDHRPAQTGLQREVTADSEALDANESAARRRALAEDLCRSSDVAEGELEEVRELPPPPGEGPRLHRIILAAQGASIGATITAEAVESGDAQLT